MKLWNIVICLFFVSSVYAQSLTGRLISKNQKEILVGAHVTLTHEENQTIRSEITDAQGLFSFQDIPEGKYQLEITYIGYQSRSLTVDVLEADYDLGDIIMDEGVLLNEVKFTESVIGVVQKGDTTEFNSAAYKTLPDASAEDLIGKMPTVVIQDGEVQAQGEKVQRVLVDGKPFFGNDPTAALRNLPSEIVEKIQIFDDQSDQSKFTGFDDGESVKTVNIVTKKAMRNGQFGRVYGGYGTDQTYQVGGNINFFQEDQRISLLGMANNINIQNFSSEDLLGVVSSQSQRRRGPGGGGPGGGRGEGPGGNSGNANEFLVSSQSGISSTEATGINLTDQWGKNLSVATSYFFNHTNNNTEESLFEEYFQSTPTYDKYQEDLIAHSSNINHRFSGKFEYTLDENNAIMWRPRVTWQSNEGEESLLGQFVMQNEWASSNENFVTTDFSALNFSSDLLWRHKFDTPRRTLSILGRTGYSPQKGHQYLLAESKYGDVAMPEISLLDQYAYLDQGSWNGSANILFTEPIGRSSMLMLNYKLSYKEEDSEKETYEMNEVSLEYDAFDEDLSNVFSSDYIAHELGGGYNFRKGDFMLMGRANIEYASLAADQLFPLQLESMNSYFNILPMAMMRYRFSRTEDLRVFYRSSVDLPSLTQLQNVIDNSNPYQLVVGNPSLKQANQHSLNARYSSTNTDQSSVFFTMLSASFYQNYIGTSTYFSAADYAEIPSLDPNAQLYTYANLTGQWNIRSMVTYGKPVEWLRSNFSVDLSGNYSVTPGLINEALNKSKTQNWGVGLTLSSNISDRIDFTLSSRTNTYYTNNTLESYESTNYFTQNSKVKLDWILGKGWIYRTEVTHQYYGGLSESLDQNYWLWNMSFGKKIGKDDRGEISLSVFDLLKQNNSLARTVNEIYTQDLQTNVLTQYFMLNFKYDLQRFKQSK